LILTKLTGRFNFFYRFWFRLRFWFRYRNFFFFVLLLCFFSLLYSSKIRFRISFLLRDLFIVLSFLKLIVVFVIPETIISLVPVIIIVLRAG